MRALFETLPIEAGEDLLLLHFARTEDDVLFRRRARGAGRAAGPPGALRRRRRHTDHAALLQQLVPDVARRDVYFCGPPGMAVAARAALAEAGLPVENLHEERFVL